MRARIKRLWIVAVAGVLLSGAAALTLMAISNSAMYYRTPADLLARPVEEGREFRLGGLVETGSLTYGEGAEIRFLVTDGVESRAVRYVGPVPDLFREGQGVIADGTLVPGGDGVFQATRILAKHDENYVPRELRDLKHTEGGAYGNGAR